jgi:hypothetical protein
MSMVLHERYDGDEQRLIESSADELWTNELIDLVVDSASPILNGAQWDGVPSDAPQRWAERSTAILALAAMSLRSTRAAALMVRAGLGPEAWPHVRRLREAAGHAQCVAADESGQYAENWLHHRGKATSPRIAFGSDSEDDVLWKLMSGHAHAAFPAYANAVVTLDGRRLLHRVGPSRDLAWDNITLWLSARTLIQILAGVLKVHPHIDQRDFLRAGEVVVRSENRLEKEIATVMGEQNREGTVGAPSSDG